MQITRKAWRKVVGSVGARKPETAGILMGPYDSTVVDTFIFDKKGLGDKYNYEPDTAYLNCMIDQNIISKELKGLIHSHPPGFEKLSSLDLEFVEGVFDGNPDLKGFWMGLVLDPPCKGALLGAQNFLCYCVCRNMKVTKKPFVII